MFLPTSVRAPENHLVGVRWQVQAGGQLGECPCGPATLGVPPRGCAPRPEDLGLQGYLTHKKNLGTGLRSQGPRDFEA